MDAFRHARMALGMLLILVGTTILAVPASAGNGWHAAPCPFDTSEAKLRVECGWLEVPENHLPGGAPVRIFTAIFHSAAADKRPDPVLFLNGGPGSAGVQFFAAGLRRPFLRELIGKRDWIVFDQRGNGRSTPRLDCDPEPGPDDRAALIACRDRLMRAGIDLSQYNSLQVARDAEALRQALGIERWNLYGSSYGSRIALTIARLYPDRVRAIVHDSGFLPQDQPLLEDNRGAEVTLLRLMARCAADAMCKARHPLLRARFEDALGALASTALHVGDRTYDDAAAVQAVYQLVFNHNGQADFPTRARLALDLADAIAALHGPRIDRLARAAAAFDQETVPEAGRGGFGAALSVDCNEERPFETVEALTAAMTTRIQSALLKRPEQFFESCAVWPSGRAPASESEPVRYSGPQLAFTGEFDASLSLFTGGKLVRLYPGAREVLFRNGSHTQLRRDALDRPASDDDYTLCAARIAAAFFDQPRRRPASACARSRRLDLVPKRNAPR